MSDGTPEPVNTDPVNAEPVAEGAAPKKPIARRSAPKKPAARKPAAKKAAAQTSAAEPLVEEPLVEEPLVAEPAIAEPALTEPESTAEVTPAPEPAPASAVQERRSVLESIRRNRMGPLTAGLVVAITVGLLLSVLVPEDPTVLPLTILAALVVAAVGATVRAVSVCKGLRRQIDAFIAAALGVHLMAVTGSVGGGNALLDLIGAEGPGFGDSLLAALTAPPVSSGVLLAGLAAAIVVGWGERSRDHAAHHGH
ncbi:hypothetical protein [Demequina sp.]|uniref:hypothetical protein n=1 Tax=Demequina sp. TaxID=2050685 RepID=UPI003A846F8C